MNRLILLSKKGPMAGACPGLFCLRHAQVDPGPRMMVFQSQHPVEIAGAVTALSRKMEWPLDRPEQRLLNQAVDKARAQLDRGTFDQAWAAGEKLTIEEAVEIMNKVQ